MFEVMDSIANQAARMRYRSGGNRVEFFEALHAL